MTDWLLAVVRYGLGLTLGAAATWKIKDFPAFRMSLADYGVPASAGRFVAAAVITVEMATAITAFTPAADPPVGVLGSALGTAFLSAHTYVLATGRQAMCVCFGRAAAEPVSPRTAAKAALVLVAGLLLLLVGAPTSRSPHLADVGVALAVLLAAVKVLSHWSSPGGRRPG